MKQVGNTILAKGVNHILAKRDNSAWPKGAKLSGFSKRDQRCFYDGRRADSLCDAGYAQRLEMAVCISGKLPPSAGRGTLPD